MTICKWFFGRLDLKMKKKKKKKSNFKYFYIGVFSNTVYL